MKMKDILKLMAALSTLIATISIAVVVGLTPIAILIAMVFKIFGINQE